MPAIYWLKIVEVVRRHHGNGTSGSAVARVQVTCRDFIVIVCPTVRSLGGQNFSRCRRIFLKQNRDPFVRMDFIDRTIDVLVFSALRLRRVLFRPVDLDGLFPFFRLPGFYAKTRDLRRRRQLQRDLCQVLAVRRVDLGEKELVSDRNPFP